MYKRWLNSIPDAVWTIAALLLGALLIHFVVSRIIRRAAAAWAKRSAVTWDDILVQHHVITRATHLLPGAFLLLVAPALLEEGLQLWLRKIVLAYMAIMGVSAVSALINAVHSIYQQKPHAKGRSLKGVVQMIQIMLLVCGIILALSALMDASPWKFLSGLGALSAVLMLVFKDSILGLVASVQVSANDSVRVGDWVELPKYGADGDVIDINLTSVTIRNFDKTISTIPTYALVSDPVKNWRGMSESGARRIKRAIDIDMHTVQFCDDAMLERFSQYAAVAEYMKSRREEVTAWNNKNAIDTSHAVNGRRLTNLGCFRAYLRGYLKSHPMVSDKFTFLIRHLAPTDKGLPIELYIFCSDPDWLTYEDVQADIFDHIIAAVPEFDLAVFQSPSGRLESLLPLTTH